MKQLFLGLFLLIGLEIRKKSLSRHQAEDKVGENDVHYC